MSQIMPPKHRLKVLAFAVLAVAAAGASAHAQGRDTYGVPSIMQPEPGSPEARESSRPAKPSVQRAAKPSHTGRRARGSSTYSTIPTYQSPVKPLGVAPRSIDGPQLTSPTAVPTPVPGFARVPAPPTSLSGSGQTFQDRAIGCAHYGATQGVGAGQIGSYTGGCVNTR